MRRVGQTRRRDQNEGAIVQELGKCGVTVLRISGKGIPDLLCYHEMTGFFLLEVKTAKGQLTEAQAETTVPFHVARSVEEAVLAFWSEVGRKR